MIFFLFFLSLASNFFFFFLRLKINLSNLLKVGRLPHLYISQDNQLIYRRPKGFLNIENETNLHVI